MSRIRLIPIVLFGLVSLLALKGLDLMSRGGIEVGGPAQALADDKRTPLAVSGGIAAEPTVTDPIVTGSAAKAEEPPPAPGEAGATDLGPSGDGAAPAEVKPVEAAPPLVPLGASSPSERALLERLQQRREDLDQQARELDMRENLLKAAEKRIEERIGELKSIEAKVGTVQQQREQEEQGRMKNLVVMYEAMKAKDAARIFDKLELSILVDVVVAMKPAKVADIMAAMDAQAAQRLTVALANRAKPKSEELNAGNGAELPKIEGTSPNG